jgi:NADH dehydrogenase
VNVVTGAFGYIGRYITRQLLEQGEAVRTITTHPHKPDPFGGAVQAFPYHFDQPDRLIESLRGASTLYNTYWIRFPYEGLTFKQAVRNTTTLFECARKAGVGKIVHISVTQAEVSAPLPYYAGKGLQEQALVACGVPYSIVRPTLVFGVEDILVNNIAWLLRRFPLFPIFGSGQYRLQPIYVADLARIAVECAGRGDPAQRDATGPETFTFEAFVRLMATKIKPAVKLVHVPPALGISLGKLIGFAVGDVLLTGDELRGLMEERLTSSEPPNGTTPFSGWLEAHHHELGTTYSSEIQRHFKWRS